MESISNQSHHSWKVTLHLYTSGSLITCWTVKKKCYFYLLEFLYGVATLFFISLCYKAASTPRLLKIMGFPQHYGPTKYSTLFFKVEHFYIVQKISKKKVDTNFWKNPHDKQECSKSMSLGWLQYHWKDLRHI